MCDVGHFAACQRKEQAERIRNRCLGSVHADTHYATKLVQILGDAGDALSLAFPRNTTAENDPIDVPTHRADIDTLDSIGKRQS